MKTLAFLLTLIWTSNVFAFPIVDTSNNQTMTRKQKRIAVTLILIERIKAMNPTLPVQLQLIKTTQTFLIKLE